MGGGGGGGDKRRFTLINTGKSHIITNSIDSQIIMPKGQRGKEDSEYARFPTIYRDSKFSTFPCSAPIMVAPRGSRTH
jgi:hypothetical protein